MARFEFYHADWRDLIHQIPMIDTILTDPPYSDRTAKGFRGATGKRGEYSKGIEYGSITREHVDDLAAFAVDRCRFWFVSFGDHITWNWFESSFASRDWYTFAPVPWCKLAAPPRFLSDGPSPQVEFLFVARRRTKVPARYRPGFYQQRIYRRQKGDPAFVGRKPVQLLRRILRDYSEPGDLVLDPFAGTGTTGIACAIEGRGFIGTEVNPTTAAYARDRLQIEESTA